MNLSPVRATALAIGLLYEFSFTPVNLKEINAFALPGGPMSFIAACSRPPRVKGKSPA
jgi:hypothetical protein